jgi:hypothetical protein
MSDGAYPRPVNNFPAVDGEKLKREFQERQRQSRKEIRERKRKLEATVKAGDMAAVRAIGPLYQ